MKRSFLIGSVLTLMLVGTLSAGSPAEARRCPFDMCVGLYNQCEASCNGNRSCIKACQRDYTECLCSNCSFSCGELPRTAPKAGTSRVAAGPDKANVYAPTLPVDAFFRRAQAVR